MQVVELVHYLRTNCDITLHAEPGWFEGIAKASAMHKAILPLCFPDSQSPATSEGEVSPVSLAPSPPLSLLPPTAIAVEVAVEVADVATVKTHPIVDDRASVPPFKKMKT